MSIFSRVCDSKLRIIQMLDVYERAYRFYVVTYKICQILQSWDKLVSTSISIEHRDCGITVRSSGKWFWPMSNKKCGPLPPGSAVNLKMLCGVWSSLQPDHETNKSPRRMQVSPPTRNDNGNLFAFRRVHCVLVLSFLSEPLLNRLLDCEQSLIFLLSHSRSRA